jgi:putative nucleotidyltransferase with HDIG domain
MTGPVGRERGRAGTALPLQALGRQPRILVLEDQAEIRGLVAAMLAAKGCPCDQAASLGDARRMMQAARYDLLIVDVHLPDGSGLSLAGRGEPEAPLVIVITGNSDIQTAVAAIRGGAIDFVTKPFTAADFLERLDRALEELAARTALERHARTLEALVRLKTEELSRTSRQVDEVCDMTVCALGAALNLKDHETADHCARVSQNSVRLGRMLGLSGFELRNLRWGAYLHDVGKIGIPEPILLKPGPLTEEERRVMEKHPVMGCAMIRTIDFLKLATDLVIAHHERYDGRGYPHGLAGDRIPLHARVFAIMDALDALSSDRPYRAANPLEAGVREIEKQAGTQFDPEVVGAFLQAPPSAWLAQGRVPAYN